MRVGCHVNFREKWERDYQITNKEYIMGYKEYIMGQK